MFFEMLRRSLILVALLCADAAHGADIPALVRQVKPAIVQIFSYDRDYQLMGTGTAFFISPDGNCLTNYHVIEGADTIIVTGSDIKGFSSAKILVADEEHDVAELKVYGVENAPCLLLGSSVDAVEGQRVLVIGNPRRLEGTVSDGIISAFRDNRTLIQITAPISPGSSGSPVIDAESGKVIGIAEMIRKDGENLGFAISVEVVKTAIAKASPQHLWQPPKTNATPSEETAQEIFRRAEAAYNAHSYREALAYFNQYIELQPSNSLAHLYRGLAHLDLKEYDEAVGDFTVMIQLKATNASGYGLRGLAYLNLGRYNDSLADCNEAIRLKPERVYLYERRAKVYDALGDHARAEADRKRAKDLMRR